MNLIKISCNFCNKIFLKPAGRINEAKKFNWKQYCSKKCQNQSKITGIREKCANPLCGKIVFRTLNQFKKSKSERIFCCSSCAAIVNNSAKRKIKTCPICNKQFYGGRKYCSRFCYLKMLKSSPKTIKIKFSKDQIINTIKIFYKKI